MELVIGSISFSVIRLSVRSNLSHSECEAHSVSNQTQDGSAQADEPENACHTYHNKMHETFDDMAHRAASAEQYIREHAGDAAHIFHDKKPEVEKAVKQTAVKTIDFIERNPVMSAGIAFGAGILLTVLIRK